MSERNVERIVKKYADIIIHVVDASDPELIEHSLYAFGPLELQITLKHKKYRIITGTISCYI